MGKKAKLKQLRKMASELPSLQRSAVEKEQHLGSALIAQGITEINGKRVDPNKIYIKSTGVKLPVNHNRAMKKLFLKHGEVGAAVYVRAVNEFMEKQKAKATDATPEKEDADAAS